MVRHQLLTTLALVGLLAGGPARAGIDPALRRALAVGDCATAVALDPAPATDAGRLAIGRCLARVGQPEQALARLDAITDPGLQAYARLLRGAAMVEAGRYAEAVAALEGLELAGAAGERAALLRGRALVELGRWEEARATLNPLLVGEAGRAGHVPEAQGADPGEVRWWLAQGAIRRGEPDKAVPVLLALWARNPSSPWVGPAEAWLASRGVPPTGAASAAVVRERVAALDAQRRYPEALALRDGLGEPLSAGEEARLAFRAKDYPRAVAAFARLPDPSPSQRFDHALAASRTGDYALAARLYRALVEAAPGSREADEASYKLGYLEYDAGRLESAVEELRAHLERYPASRHADEARWFTGWSLYRLGRLDEADAALGALLARSGGSSLAPKAAYWRGRIALAQGREEEARQTWRDLLARWPTSGAAWFASERLGQRPEGVATAGPPPTAPEALRGPAWERGLALASVGLHTWAQAELQPLRPKAEAAGQQARVALALALVEAGDYVGAQDLARPWCGTPWKAPGDPWALRACYPRPEADLVTAVAAEGGLDPLLPYAIMTAESALKPWVTSIAGARGLMQLMPALAGQHHAVRFGDRPYDADDLYQPAYNAALGTAELGSLLARFQGRGVDPALPLVIAGYNGGADAVERWLAAATPTVEADRWAEDVGYTETRRYVQRVLGYLQTYRYVYGGG